MDPQLAPGTPEPVLQGAGSLGVRGWRVLMTRLLLLLPSPLLSILWLDATSRPARVPGPDTDTLRFRVVETLRTPGGASHSLQAGVEHIALVWQLAGVDTVLTGTVSITCRKDRVSSA